MENTGVIRNLGLPDVSIQGIAPNTECWAAGIAADNKGTIEQCYVTGSVTGAHRTAGIAAHSSGTIRNCYTIIKSNAKGKAPGSWRLPRAVP